MNHHVHEHVLLNKKHYVYGHIDRRQKLLWDFGSGKTASSDTGPSTGKFFFH